MQNGNIVRQASTDANGFYRMQLPVGNYTIEASKTNYATEYREHRDQRGPDDDAGLLAAYTARTR